MYDLIFFDVPKVGLTRYPTKVSNVIKQGSPNINIAFMYYQKDQSKDCDFDTYYMQETNLDEFFETNKNAVVCFLSNRIPDLYLMDIVKSKQLTTIMLQHGVIVDGNTIDRINVSTASKIISRISKAMNYLLLMRKIAKRNKKSFIVSLLKLVRTNQNISEFIQSYINPNLRGDYALVYGESWRKFYSERYHYPLEDTIIVGNPDLDGLEDIKQASKSDYDYCYISQTIVEDGMIERPRYEHVVNILNDLSKTGSVVIKTHPRNDLSIFDNLSKDIKIITENKFPNAEKYLGHSSTLLSKVLYIEKDLEIINYEEISNDFFLDYASTIYDVSKEDVVTKRNNSDKKSLSEFKYHHFYNKNGAINEIADFVIKKVNKE